MARTNLQFECTTWFHLTRTFKGNDFKEGILQLGKSFELYGIYGFISKKAFCLKKNGKISKNIWRNNRLFIMSGFIV
ncbi:hypothetical protein C0966_06650 [Bacillus methanolicus]|nr:hypothetical protein [Bacillus methanolicus]